MDQLHHLSNEMVDSAELVHRDLGAWREAPGGECQAGGQTIPLGEAWAEPNIYMNYIEPYMPVMFHLLLLISLVIRLLLFNIVHKAFLPRHLQTSASAGISSPLESSLKYFFVKYSY